MNRALETEIEAYLEMVKTVSLKKPEKKFALAQPTLGPLHQWYIECHEALGKKSQKKLGSWIGLMWDE
jgi:hypothetical protein